MLTIGDAIRRSERFTDADREAAEVVLDLAEAWKDGTYDLATALRMLRETRNLPTACQMPPVAIACLSAPPSDSRKGDLMDLLDRSIRLAGKKWTPFGYMNSWDLRESDAAVRLHFPDRDPEGGPRE